jgi:RNA polymerase sigma-70 factor (ECF subfamily)
MQPTTGTDSALDAFVESAIVAGASRWAGVVVASASYREHLEACGATADGTDVAALHGSDLYLACACTSGDETAIELLVKTFEPDLRLVLRKRGHAAAVIDDVQQALFERLLTAADGARPRIAEYAGRGDLRSWLRVAAIREAISLARRRDRRTEVESNDPSFPGLVPDNDPELQHLRALYGAASTEALAAASAALSDEHRSLLHAYYVERASIDVLGERLGVHRVTALRRLNHARNVLVEGVRGRLATELGVDPTELASILRLVKSQVHVTLRRILASGE